MTIEHHALLALFGMIVGSCVGSFLNVCAYRIPRGMSVSRPRSRCPGCGGSIRARDNIPALGWLLLRGRCRDCRTPISARYPAVELAVGILFAMPYMAAVALASGDPWEGIGAGRLLVILAGSWTVAVAAAWVVLVGPPAWLRLIARRAAGGCGAPTSTGLRPRGAGD